MHDGRRSGQFGAARGAGSLSEFNSNSWGYQQRVRSRVERSAVVIDARRSGDWMTRGRCRPGPGVAQTIGVGPCKTCFLRRASHRDGIGSRRAREGNNDRDTRAAYRSARSDRNNRSIITYALRQIIRGADERICSSRKYRSGLRKVCIDICRPASIRGSQHQIVLAIDTHILRNWNWGRGRYLAPGATSSESDTYGHKYNRCECRA